jgi:hypothetical protein
LRGTTGTVPGEGGDGLVLGGECWMNYKT